MSSQYDCKKLFFFESSRFSNLIFETTKLKDATLISSLGEEIMLQLMKSLHELGAFEAGHEGIEIRSFGSTIIKTSQEPDSNNVFLRYPICEPCGVSNHSCR